MSVIKGIFASVAGRLELVKLAHERRVKNNRIGEIDEQLRLITFAFSPEENLVESVSKLGKQKDLIYKDFIRINTDAAVARQKIYGFRR